MAVLSRDGVGDLFSNTLRVPSYVFRVGHDEEACTLIKDLASIIQLILIDFLCSVAKQVAKDARDKYEELQHPWRDSLPKERHLVMRHSHGEKGHTQVLVDPLLLGVHIAEVDWEE